MALPVVVMTPPDDALLRAVLVKLFDDRQLAVDESVLGYLAPRIERSFAGAQATRRPARRRGDAARTAVNQGVRGRSPARTPA